MSWEDEVEQIAERRRRALELGGPEAVERHRARGRLTVRERIERLLDGGTFREEGPIAGSTEVDDEGRPVSFSPANYVVGTGRVRGRPVVVGGEDFTQRGGSPSPAGLRKSIFSEELALALRVPLVRFLEGAGGSVTGTGGKGAPPPAGEPVSAPARFASIARILKVAPVVSAAAGAVAGFPAARLVASHFAVMTRTSQVLIGGPALVERALGVRRTKEELGGPEVHLRSGVVDNLAEDEEDACDQIRRFLSYLPTRAGDAPPRAAGRPDDPAERREERLLGIVPRDRRRHYDMRELIELVADRGSIFETSALYGRSQITALARFGGRPVGLWANDGHHDGGAMGAEGARKVRRFLILCETFRLPVVALVDEPGFMIGPESEAAGTIRAGMEAIAAAVETTVPWISVIVRKAYGVAAAAHFGPGGAGARVLSWPSAETGALPVEGGVAVAFRREIAAAADPEKRRAELEEEMASRRSAFPRAESFSVNDLIDPRDTRSEICRWLELFDR